MKNIGLKKRKSKNLDDNENLRDSKILNKRSSKKMSIKTVNLTKKPTN